MLQIYMNISYVFIIPPILGILTGLCLIKFKKTYVFSAILLTICIILWCIVPNINTHGSEGPGIMLWIYSLFTAAVSIVEAIKFFVRKCKERKCIQ